MYLRKVQIDESSVVSIFIFMDKIPMLANTETMTSLEIAEITGRLHKDVMRAIRNMEPAWEKINGRKFTLVEYEDAKGEKRPCYQLTKTECLYIATKFNDEARAKLVIRWEELEMDKRKAYPMPQTFGEALMLAAKQQLQIEEQQKQLTEQEPKVNFANAMLASSTSCLVGELAKVLTQNGYEIGQNRLFKWLRDNNYLGKWGERKNIPLQQYVEQGLFKLKKGTYTDLNGTIHTTTTVKVTGKGQEYFINKFLNSKK